MLTEKERLALFELNKNLAYSIAYKYNMHMDIDDSKQEALLALWVATDRFDPTRSESFSSYAYWIISEALQRILVKSRKFLREGVDIPITEVENELSYSHECYLEIDLRSMLKTLTPPKGLIYQMKLDGYSNTTIAEATNQSKQSVGRALREAEEDLKTIHGRETNDINR